MATWAWAWYNGATWTDFGSNAVDKIGFYGWLTDVATSFGRKIYVASYNDTMHLRKIADGTDDCITPHMTGVKYVAAGTCNINHAGVVALAANVPTNNQCIRITFADAGMGNTENSYFYSHGAATTDAPVGVTTVALEKGNLAWTAVAGSGTKLTLSNPTGASAVWYVAMSITPTAVGAKDANATWRIETDYY